VPNFLLLVVEGTVLINELLVGSRRPDPRARDLDLVTSFKPHPQAKGDRNEIPYVPASSWIGVLRHLLEKYYNLPANMPRIRRKGTETIIAPIHECKTLNEIQKCPVCKIFSRRDVVAWFDDMEPWGNHFNVTRGSKGGEYLIYNENKQLVAQVFVKDEVIIPREIEKIDIDPQQLGLKGGKSLKGEELLQKGFRFEPIPRQVQAVSGTFKFCAKFDMTKLTIDDIKPFFIGLALLEDRYVGRRGSRGYGRIEFRDIKFELRTASYYEGNPPIRLDIKYDTSRDAIKQWDKLKQTLENIIKKIENRG